MTTARRTAATLALALAVLSGTAAPANALGPRGGYTQPCVATGLIVSPFAYMVCKYQFTSRFGWR